jgi:hypothetical protein
MPDKPVIVSDKLKGIKKGAGALFFLACSPVKYKDTSRFIDLKDSTSFIG